MYCPKCGQQIPDGSKFCAKCGADLRSAERGKQDVGGGAAVVSASSAPGASSAGANGFSSTVSSLDSDDGNSASRRGIVKLVVLAAAAIVIVALAVMVITQCSASGSGTAQDVANSVAAAYTTMFENADNGGWRQGTKELLDLYPPDAVDAIVRHYGYASVDELLDDYSSEFDSLESGMGSNLASIMDDIDLEVAITPQGSTDSDFIDSTNEAFGDYGLDNLIVQDARGLSGTITVTAKSDVGNLAAGESYTQKMSSIGLSAIEIDGKWYLWSGQFNW